MDIQLDRDQEHALDEAEAWYRLGIPGIYRIYGAAGTGKTTLIKPLIARLGLPLHYDRTTAGGVRVAGFTNRSVRVLNQKGIPSRTIHSFAGQPPYKMPNDPKVLEQFDNHKRAVAEATSISAQKQAQAELNAFLRRYRVTSDLQFAIDPDSIFSRTDLVTLDEVSMIDRKL